MSRLIHCVLVAAVIGCASNAPAPAELAAAADSRPPLIRMADSTNRLVEAAATVNDTASVHAQVALRETATDRARSRVGAARSAADDATRLVDAAIVQGDYINETLPRITDGGTRTASFTRYWLLGREKLTQARTLSRSAVEAADRVLECGGAECTTAGTREMQGYVEQAAGASREAESLVRIAMVYVGMAMTYVR